MTRTIEFEARGEKLQVTFVTTGGGRDLIHTCSHWELIHDLKLAGEVVEIESECFRLPVWSPSERRQNQLAVQTDLISAGRAEGLRLANKN